MAQSYTHALQMCAYHQDMEEIRVAINHFPLQQNVSSLTIPTLRDFIDSKLCRAHINCGTTHQQIGAPGVSQIREKLDHNDVSLIEDI